MRTRDELLKEFAENYLGDEYTERLLLTGRRKYILGYLIFRMIFTGGTGLKKLIT